ncbi:MAG: PEP-CTERM sorting domain-containing protein [Cyanobacteriota bacterium]|nr:PEP-CTERM sorting domain-containing protein [Cyanobacteriota bacterium]
MNRKSALTVACVATATAVLGVSTVPASAFTPAPGSQIFTGSTNFGNFFDEVVNPDGNKAFVANDNAFQVGDKIFHNFFFSPACLPGPCPNEDSPFNSVSPVNPSSITVAGDFASQGFPQINFNDFWRAAPGNEFDLFFGFDVHVLDDNQAITDVHLSFVGPSGTPDDIVDGGQVLIEERIFDFNGMSLLASGDDPLLADNLTATTNIGFDDWAELIRPVQKLRVRKNIQLRGVDDIDPTKGEEARFTGLIQGFDQEPVPEPGTMSGLLALGSMGIGAMLKRKRQASNN